MVGDATVRILSLKPQGMQFSNGWYAASPGTMVRVEAQAVNAKQMDFKLVPKGTSVQAAKALTQVDAKNGGVYDVSFSLENGAQADLYAIATDAAGETAALSVQVTTQQ